MIEIRKVTSNQERRQFFQFSCKLYKDHPYWVSWPISALVKMLEPMKCGFYTHGVAEAWLAYGNGKIVGRIVGSIDRAYNQAYAEQTAFFRFYECINDPDVAKALFGMVEDWAKSHDMKRLQGPYALNLNFDAGMLIEGFDDAPYVGMPYNLPYYKHQLESLGFRKVKDFYAFRVRGVPVLPRSLERLVKSHISKRVTYRQLNLRNLREESDLVCDLYNDAFEGYWGHVRIDRSEFYQMALDWVEFLDPRLFVFAFFEGDPMGFCMVVPDAFQVLRAIGNPVGLLLYLGQRILTLGHQTSITRCRFDTVCLRKKYQRSGLGSFLYWQFLQGYLDSGFTEVEFSPTLEDNSMIQSLIVKSGAQRSKVYRIFGRSLERDK
jgi:GNAT superfamily N-acetyltransferase